VEGMIENPKSELLNPKHKSLQGFRGSGMDPTFKIQNYNIELRGLEKGKHFRCFKDTD